jgi:Tfp pilus assembly protein PilF
MVALEFYLGAVALFVIGALLLRGTSVVGRVGGEEFEKRKKRKIIAQTLMASAAIPLVTGITTQMFPPSASMEVPEVSSAVTSDASTDTDDQITNQAPAPAVTFTAQQGNLVSGDVVDVDSFNAMQVPNSTSDVITSAVPSPAASAQYFQEALGLFKQGEVPAALDKANAAVEADPKNRYAYALRGSIYARMKNWNEAVKDYQAALQLDPANVGLKNSVANVEFVQAKYDAARAVFAGLVQDENNGDYAKYMVFMCDLMGGHEDLAAKELDAFNQVGSNASYYFANSAWSLYHQKNDDAQSWLASASRIYSPEKFKNYAAVQRSLVKVQPLTTPVLATPPAK